MDERLEAVRKYIKKEGRSLITKSKERENKMWLKHSRAYMKRLKANPMAYKKHLFKLAMSNAIRHSLTGNKKGNHWEDLVGYTLDDLKKHLEKQFTEGMTWENYGEWEIDHIIPIKVFNYDNAEHLDFKRCWALKNLRPLWRNENRAKSDKLATSFQPSLKL